MNFLNEEQNQQLARFLHEKRVEQNLNLDDISSKIGIPIQHLKTIEAGDFNEYDAFYLKMYLKKYATSLSLNIDELYQQFYGADAERPEVESTVKKQVNTSPPKYSKTKNHYGKIIGLLFAAIIVVVGLFVIVDIARGMADNSNGNNPIDREIINPEAPDLTEDQDQEDKGSEPEESTPGESTPEEEPQVNTTIDRVSHEGNIQTFEVTSNADEIIITLNFTGECWVGTSAGEAIQLESGGTITQPGLSFVSENTENIVVTESGDISFNIGNIQTIEITINDEIVDIERAGISQQWIVFNLTLDVE